MYAVHGRCQAPPVEFACEALSYVGDGTPLAGWYPVKLLPLAGVRKRGWSVRGWFFQQDKDLFEQAKERFADLNDGNPWEAEGRLTAPKARSLVSIAKTSHDIDKQRDGANKRRDDELVRGHRALKAATPTWWSDAETWLMKPLSRAYSGKVGLGRNINPGDFWPPPIAAPAFLCAPQRMAEAARLDVADGTRGMLEDDDGVPVLFGDVDALNTDDSPSLRKLAPVSSWGPRFRVWPWLDIGRPETWRMALPAKPKRLRPLRPEWFLDDRGRPLPILSDASSPLGHVVDSGDGVAVDYDAAVRTGNGVRPGVRVRLGESVRTGLEPQRVPDETENPGVDVPVPVLTCTPLSAPRMPGLVPSWGSGAPWTIMVARWMSKAELMREADKLIKLNLEPPEPIAINPEPAAAAQPEDEWAATIRNFACSKDRVYADQVGRHIAKKFGGQIGKKEQLRIGEIFTGMGWTSWRDKSGRGFQKPRPSPVLPMNPRDSLNFSDLTAYSMASRSSPAPGSPLF